ncbi:hypothetical protein [Streptomyces sp. CA-132043]|uniref:hypothetical protein n=1 Tax=Streptomyces sp. CA-132043 TaxID=3240048 RepID=UPI003D8C785F
MKIELKPDQIPLYTGDLPQLEKDHAALKKDAGHIRKTGSDVHSHFQGLSAFYKAPEAEQLFATTKPVQTRADEFADDLETVSSALSSYADEIRPLVPKLESLQRKARAFIRDHKDDEDGDYDEDLIAEHNQIRDDITATVAAFWAAERTCYNKIVALWNGPKMVAGDGSKKDHQYGFKAEDLKNAKVPWGDPVEQKHHWYDVWHWGKSFVWDGIVVDGIWGTIKGLGTLVGVDGWDAAGQAWKGLAQLGTGLAILTIGGPGAAAFMTLPDDKLPSWLRDSRNTMKQTGKALVAWDEWGKNPGRAAGAVTFNVVTTVLTGGAGGAAAGAGKAGAVAKALSVAGKAGKLIDPMTYVGKAAGAGLTKIGDIAKSLRGIGKIDMPPLPENAIELPEGAVALSDGTVHLPEGAALPKGAVELPDGGVRLPEGSVPLPEGTVKLTDFDGNTVYADPKGNLYDETGALKQHHTDAPTDIVDNAPHADTPRVETPANDRVLVGAGAAHTADNAAHVRLGSSLDDAGRFGDSAATPAAHVGDNAGGNLPGGHVGDHLPGNGTHPTPGGGVSDTTPRNAFDNGSTGGDRFSGGNPGDHTPGGHSQAPRSGSGPTHDLQGGGTDDAMPPRHGAPGTGGLDGLGRVGDDGLGGGTDGAPSHNSADSRAGTERPSFMHDGDNPYGPRGSLTDKQIAEIQVYRANHEPGYFEDFYKENGNRKNLKLVDASGHTPPQLTRESRSHPWIPAKDAPEPLKPDYLGERTVRARDENITPEALEKLDGAADKRHWAIQYDSFAERHKAASIETHKNVQSLENELLMKESSGQYKEAHSHMRDSAEDYGESIAEHHVIPEHYAGATREPLDGPLNGNDQFDQVWRREDGGFVVVEAKSNVKTRLGARNLPDGKRVSQGTREYFDDILREMQERGRTNPKEQELADELEEALMDGKLDYIVVKGNENAGAYAGYTMDKFDIG